MQEFKQVVSSTPQSSLPQTEYKAPAKVELISRPIVNEGKVRVVNGANSEYYDNLVGKKVGQVRKALRDVFNIAEKSEAYLNGIPVSEDHVIESSGQLEFIKPSGTKGFINV